MKRIVCLMLVVLIAYAGCADTKPSTITVTPIYSGWINALEDVSNTRQRIEELEIELSKAKDMPKRDKALLARIARLEAEIKSQRAELRAIIAKLKNELSEAEDQTEQTKALLFMIAEIEAALECQRVVERAEKALLVMIADVESAIESRWAVEIDEMVLLDRIAELEAEIESQREEFESSKNIYRLYEVAIESQKIAIESLEKLCRMYEAEIESQVKSRSNEESPLREEPETHQ